MAKPALHRPYARQAARRDRRAEEGGRHCRPQRLGAKKMVETAGMAHDAPECTGIKKTVKIGKPKKKDISTSYAERPAATR
jgi:hypothetical protein